MMLNGLSNKLSPSCCLYAIWLVQHTTLIREAVFCTIWWLLPRFIVIPGAENKSLQGARLKMEHLYHNSFFLELGIIIEEEAKRVLESFLCQMILRIVQTQQGTCICEFICMEVCTKPANDQVRKIPAYRLSECPTLG